MQISDIVLGWLHESVAIFKHPEYLWGIPIFFVLILFLVMRNFVRFGLDIDGQQRLLRMRLIVFVFRWIAISLLCIALATPFTTITKESEGNPRALILVDESGSMERYDMGFLPSLTSEISGRLPTTVKAFGSQTQSPIGDAALGHPEHLLLVSDGHANSGVDIMDVAQVARANNLSISAIDLSPRNQDAAVVIDAPQSVPLGFSSQIAVTVTSTGDSPVPLTILIDGVKAHDAPVLGTVFLEPELSTGYHRVEARISSTDADASNNVHYRVVQVLEKPKILVMAKDQGPLERAMAGMFDTTIVQSLPSDLSPYSAIVIDDLPASRVGGTDRIADFLRDEKGGKYGGGLVVVGGFNSFDRGAYGGSQLESLLPIKVGKAKRNLGESNIVFVIQVSGSTGSSKYVKDANGKLVEVTESEPTLDVIKAQAVSAVNSLNLRNNVGVVVFGVSTAGESYSSPQEALAASVVKLAEVKPLYNHKQDITDKIPRITGGGTTAPDIALKAAVDMLKDKSGDKTIILLTNGRFSAGIGAGDDVPAKVNTLAVVQNAYRRYGIKVQTIGVGSQDESVFALKVDESFLKQVAVAGDSTYDRGTTLSSLKVKYGDPDEKGFGESFALVPLSLTHFITRNVELDAILNGYNEVAPKEGSRMLVSTDSGYPAVTVWNYFNGRVATVTVFTASGLGPLLSGNNSDLIRNAVLWAVGDPTRKLPVTVGVEPATLEEKTLVTFVSKDPISGNCQDTPISFERSSGDTYIFSFTPQKVGFGTVCGIPYAVNGPSEFWRTGMSSRLRDATHVSDGDVFSPDQIDEIVERITTVSKRVSVEKTELRNPFIALAAILFLIEIFIRRLVKRQNT